MNNDPTPPDDLATALAGCVAHAELALRLGQSLELPDALWDLVSIVVAAGQHHDNMSPTDIADATVSARRLDEDTRTRIREVADRWQNQADAALDLHTRDEAAIASLSRAEAIADPVGAASRLIDIPALAADLVPELLLGAPVTSTDEALYYFAYLRAIHRTRRTPMLLRALLVTAVGTVEPFVTRMVHLLLHHTKPQTYASLTDPTLDVEARKLCFGPPAKWREVLVDTFGVAGLADAIDWDRIGQLWDDRNALVHRGGVVDARHHSKSGAEIGTILEPDADDVRSAIDEIGAARYGIVTAVWNHITPGMGAKLATEIWPLLWESLRAGRWRQAEGLARVQTTFAGDAETVAAGRAHRWLALDRGLGATVIRDEVQAWDTTGLSAVFEIARRILLHQDDDAIRLIHDLVQDGALTPADLANWPLFDRLWNESRLDTFAQAANTTVLDLRRA